MATNRQSYITLIRATKDEIKSKYKEPVDGQIILNTTDKTISCDEQGKRIEYTGKSTTPAIANKILTCSAEEFKESPTKYASATEVGREGKMFLTNDGYLFQVQNGNITPTTLEAIINAKIAKAQLKFEVKNGDLYITQKY